VRVVGTHWYVGLGVMVGAFGCRVVWTFVLIFFRVDWPRVLCVGKKEKFFSYGFCITFFLFLERFDVDVVVFVIFGEKILKKIVERKNTL
jgi:hypothetical protein